MLTPCQMPPPYYVIFDATCRADYAKDDYAADDAAASDATYYAAMPLRDILRLPHAVIAATHEQLRAFATALPPLLFDSFHAFDMRAGCHAFARCRY